MDKKRMSFEIKENEKVITIPISKKAEKELANKVGRKTAADYIKEFLKTEANYKKYVDKKDEYAVNALPDDIKDDCKFCKGESEDKEDKACGNYIIQMEVTYFLAINEFVRIVLRNKHIYENKKFLYELTINFFDCLYFIKGKGVMYLNLDKIRRFSLNAGFLSLSEMFSKLDNVDSLTIINNTLDELKGKILSNQVLLKEDENHLDLQKKYFENKERFYSQNLFLEEKSSTSKKVKNESNISASKMVLYYYYLQDSGDFPYFENHPQGKLVAIDDLIKEEKLIFDPKYFQLKYNLISNHSTNRIALNQVANISYVAENMLKEYPKAQKIALTELKEAKTKSK